MSKLFGNVRHTAALALFALFLTTAAIVWQTTSHAQKFDPASDEIAKSDIMAPTAGNISGRVYQDFNSNGLYDTLAGTNSIDIGVSGVLVSAFDPNGAAQGTATSGANGTYTLAATGNGPYRVEFTNLPSGMTPSVRSTDSVLGGTATDAGSTVQFINNTSTANVNLAVTRAEEFCQNNPTLVTARYARGASDDLYADNPVLFDFAYNSGTTYTDTTVANYDNPTAHAYTLLVRNLGTVNSLAYNRESNRLFAASYFKRHAGFGPGADGILNNTDDPGAIYVVNPATQTIASTFTVPGITINGHETGDYNNDNGDIGWNATGKRSLGGMALADDNSRLFVMNLENRQLYALNPTTGASLGSTANPDGLTMATPGGTGANCATGTDRRPFAVKFYRGSVYIGVVCTAESTANVNDLFAYVFQVNPTTLVMTSAPVYSVALNYSRGVADPLWPAEWQPWTTTVQAGFAYPQPWLTDIDFDRGNLILAFRDRTGDSSLDLTKRTAGDIIRACGSFGAWTTETNGRCGGTGTAPQNTGQGIGNGEFYHNDDFCTAPNNGDFHDEVGWGSVMQLPGRQNVVATLLDPIDRMISNGATFDGGVRLLNNTTGSADRAYRLYNGSGGDTQPDFGKTNGISDVVALCSAAPIEIGNRVWRDSNSNGVQDPGENGIAGVSVRLYQGGSPANYSTTPYADGFATIAYSGSTGSTSWTSTPWVEISDDNDVTNGDVRVVLDGAFSNALRLERASNGASRAISLAGNNSATLSFNYRRNGSQGATAEWFNGTSWTVLATYGAGTDAAYQSSGSLVLPLTATAIRFLNGAGNGNNDFFFVDNVQITALSNTVVTDANGEYYFTSVAPNTAYQIRLDSPANYTSGNPLSGLTVALQNQTSQLGDDDSSDSDASMVANPAGSPAGVFPVISVTTGSSGSNNHTLDVGFSLLAPSAANVSVTGRITTANGNGIRNVRVFLTEANGTVHNARTGSFGYYVFEDIPGGQNVVVSIASKRYTFPQTARLVTISEDATELDWISND